MPFSYSELSGIWKCAIDLCLLWSETGFFPRISLHRLKTTKNPVSLISAVVTDARVARNRVFSENIVTPPKNYEKPRLKTTKNPVSLVSAVVTDARVARNRVFSENLSLQSVI